MSNQKIYWFGGKRYLLGWGLPVRWQGWAVLIAFIAAEFAGLVLVPWRHDAVLSSVFCAVVLFAFLVVAQIKCEPSD